MSVNYVVGIDFGDGETSASFCSPNNTDSRVTEIQLGPDKAIKSAIIITENSDTVVIGEQAGLLIRQAQGKFRISFKRIPSRMNEEDKTLVKLFMREVYRLVRNNARELADNNHTIFIACPSHWDRHEQQVYTRLARQAGLPVGGIIKESRAAFIQAQLSGGMQEAIRQGALVIDMGSSTIDLTYFSRETPHPLDAGYNHGACKVELALLAYLQETNPVTGQFLNAVPCGHDLLLFRLRHSKERFYTMQQYDPQISEYFIFDCFHEAGNAMEFRGIQIELTITAEFMNELLGRKRSGYYNELESHFKHFRDTVLENRPVRGIILTGGASRMGFISRMVEGCFGCRNIQIDPNPSVTISNGIALTARADWLSNELHRLLVEETDRQLQITDLSGPLSRQVIAILHAAIMQTIDFHMDRLKRGDIKTINQLESQLKSGLGVKASRQSVERMINGEFRLLIEQRIEGIVKILNRIIATFDPTAEAIRYDSDLTRRFTPARIGGIEMSFVSALCENIEKVVSESVVESVLMICWNLVAGILGLVAYGVYYVKCLWTLEKRKSLDDFMTLYVSDFMADWNNRDTELDDTEREKVHKKYNTQEKQSISETIRKDVEQVFTNQPVQWAEELNLIYADTIRKIIGLHINKYRILID